MNLDSEWRSRPAAETALALATYLFRAPETLATLLGRPSAAMLARWDRLTRARQVPAIAATDAHALWDAPSYDVCFRTITTRLELPASLTGVAATDAEAVVAALRAGHHYTEIDALAGPAGFDFTGRGAGPVVHEGDVDERRGRSAGPRRRPARRPLDAAQERRSRLVDDGQSPGIRRQTGRPPPTGSK